MDPNQKTEASITPDENNAAPEVSDQLEQSPDQEVQTSSSESKPAGEPQTPKGKNTFKFISRIWSRIRRFDLYLMAFVLLVIIGGIIVYLAIQHNNKATNNNSPSNQSLSQSALNQLNNNDVNVGSNNQNLNIESNTVFSGSVLVRNDLQVAGTLKLGGSLSLSTLDVSGVSSLDQVSIAGSTNISGNLSVQKGLTANGGATFGGAISAPTISVSTLQLTGDIDINHHIITNGSLPKVSGNSSNLGSGGTVSVGGDDTAGVIVVHNGSGSQAGCLASLSFAQPYASTPHVVITAVGNGANGVGGYYISNLSATGFSVCVDQNQDNLSISFDYLTID